MSLVYGTRLWINTRGQKACKMINTNTVYLKESDGSLDLRRSQYNENLEEGLYCKVGYKYNNEDDNKGVTEKIEESEQEKVTLKQRSNLFS